MAGVFRDDEMQIIEHPGCLDYFKSHASDTVLQDSLFVYRHLKSLKFMLARWIGQPVFLPILELGVEPILNDEIVAAYRAYCHPGSVPSAGTALREARDNEIRESEEYEHEHREMRAKLLRDECGIKVPDRDGTAFLPVGAVSD